LDYSKNRINAQTLDLLCQVAQRCDLSQAVTQMICGNKVNFTEDQAALHTALRAQADTGVHIDDESVYALVSEEKKRLKQATDRIYHHQWLSKSGKPIEHIVNIGIGGSDLGPKMLYHALMPFSNKKIKCHFVSNVDGAALKDVLADIDAQSTLFVITSKSFTTQETLLNAKVFHKFWRFPRCDPKHVVQY